MEIRHCGDALCGQVVWLRHPFDENGCELRDVENPDSDLRRRAVVGIELLRDLRPSPDDPGEWSGGEIYDPTSGRSYRAVVEMDGPDRLQVRGYLGIRLLGRTTTWVRVGSENQCRERRSSTRHFVPLVGFVVPTVVIGYGFVIPGSCIAGVNELTRGFRERDRRRVRHLLDGPARAGSRGRARR